MVETEYRHPLMAAYWKQLDTRFPQVEAVFEDVMAEALAVLTRDGLDAYLDAARVVGKLGRGVEPMLAFLEEWPSVAQAVGEAALPATLALIQRLQKSPNGRAITPFLQTLAPVARRQPAAGAKQPTATAARRARRRMRPQRFGESPAADAISRAGEA